MKPLFVSKKRYVQIQVMSDAGKVLLKPILEQVDLLLLLKHLAVQHN